MPSSSGQMLPVLTLSRRLGSKNSLLVVGLSRGYDFIQRILEKDAFKPVAEVSRRLLSGASPRFRDVALFTQDLHRQPAKQLARRHQREMRRVIRKRPDLIRQTCRSPTRMHPGRNAVNPMMEIHGEIKQPARRENPHQFPHNLGWRLSMIDDVVADHDVEALISERQRFADGSHRLRAPLPTRKQTAVTNRQRIYTNAMLAVETEDQTVRAAPHFDHASVTRNRLKTLQQIAHASRRPRHRGDRLFLAAAQMFSLVLLIGELPFQRPSGKFSAPIHPCDLCFRTVGL